MATQPILEMTAVEIAEASHSGRGTVRAVDWSVETGECWVVAGVQGSGVSAFLETAAGLRPVVAGALQLFGRPVAELRGDAVSDIRTRVGFLFSGSGRLFGSLTAIENVTLPLRYHQGMSMEAAVEEVRPLLEWLELQAVVGAMPSRLGRGMRLRVALARALALRPELVVLDDPVAGLDSGQIRWWRSIVTSLIAGSPWLHRKPATVIVGTEMLRPFLSIGHRFALIHRGAFQLLGDSGGVMALTEDPVREVLGDAF